MVSLGRSVVAEWYNGILSIVRTSFTTLQKRGFSEPIASERQRLESLFKRIYDQSIL